MGAASPLAEILLYSGHSECGHADHSGNVVGSVGVDTASLVSAETQPRSPIRVLYEKGAGTLLHLVQESDGQVPEIGREETRHGLPALGPRRLPHRVQLRL